MSGYNYNAPVVQISNTLYSTTLPSSSSTSLASNQSRISSKNSIVIVISVMCAIILIMCAVILFVCKKLGRKQNQKELDTPKELDKQKEFEKQKDEQMEKKNAQSTISIKNENQYASGHDKKPSAFFYCQWGCLYTTKEEKLLQKHKEAHESHSMNILKLKAFCPVCTFKAEKKEEIKFHLQNHHLKFEHACSKV